MARARVVISKTCSLARCTNNSTPLLHLYRRASRASEPPGRIRSFFKPRPQPISGYIVLLPEIPSDSESNNPLMQLDDLPKYDSIKPDRAFNAIGKLAINFDYELGLLEKRLKSEDERPTDFNSLRDPLEKSLAKLEYGWFTVYNLQHTNFDPNDRMPFIMIEYTYSNYSGQRHVSPIVYQFMKQLQAKHSDDMTESQRYLVHRYILEGEMVGIDMEQTKIDRLQKIMKKIYQEKNNFRVKALQETSTFVYRLFHKDEVKEFPTSLKKLMAVEQINPNRGPWDIKLYDHIFEPFMKYCTNEQLRKRIYMAYVQRASFASTSRGDVEIRLNNSEHIEKLRNSRGHLADTLGYENYAEMCLQTRSMAGGLDTVLEMISTLELAGKEQANSEISSLLEFAKERGYKSDVLALWDIPFWRCQHLASMGVHEDFHNDVRAYFQLPLVLDGLFKLCSKLFGVVIQKSSRDIEKIDENIEFYDVHTEDDSYVGSFYLDPYARNSKDISGMIPCRSRSAVAGHTPVANVVFRFQRPMLGRPALLEFSDIVEVFRTFGHTLRFLLSRTEYTDMSGSVEMDTYFLPHSFLEFWLYQYPVVAGLSCHCDSGERLPESMHQALCAERLHLFAYDLMHQLYMSQLDMTLNASCIPFKAQSHSSKPFWVDVMRDTWARFLPMVALPADDWHPCSMRSIFSDKYNAQYYSRIWSEMLACDIFSTFLNAGLQNEARIAELGRQFRHTVLEQSGCASQADIFRRFMGRDPSLEAIIRQYGLDTSCLQTPDEINAALKNDSELDVNRIL